MGLAGARGGSAPGAEAADSPTASQGRRPPSAEMSRGTANPVRSMDPEPAGLQENGASCPEALREGG